MPILQSWLLAAALAVAQSALVLTAQDKAEVVKMDISEAYIMAKVAQGETGRLFPGTEAEAWVMWTIRNRVASPDFPDDVWTAVEKGYQGHKLVDGMPDKDLMLLAREVLEAPAEADPIDGCLYVFSSDDVNTFGFDVTTSVHSVQNGRWGLYFYREMPEGEE